MNVAAYPRDLVTEESRMSACASPDRLRAHYRRVVLISHPRHLEGREPSDHETLFVVTEWWTWWMAAQAGFHAIHYDACVGDWPPDLGDPDDLYLRACDWIYIDGEDASRYHGVSLGRLIGTQATLAWQACITLDYALSMICERFQPKEMQLLDLSTHFAILDSHAKRHLVRGVAQRYGVELVDSLDEPDPEDPCFHTRPIYRPQPRRRGMRDALRRAYARLVGASFHVRWILGGRRPKVFFFVSTLTLENLVHFFERGRIAPVVLAETVRKDWSFLLRCWAKGVILTHLPAPAAGSRRNQDIERIIAAFERHWNDDSEAGVETARRAFLRGHLFRSGTLASLAEQVDRYRALIGRHRFRRLISADVSNPIGRTLCELGFESGIPCDELLNGMFICRLKDPTRCGDGASPATLTRALVMGPINDVWLDDTDSPVDRAMTGCPAIDLVRARSRKRRSDGRKENALVLPSNASIADHTVLHSEIIPIVVNCVRAFTNAGYSRIRIRPHPGTDNIDFYRTLVDHFQLDCEIGAAGTLAEHVAWADTVVGPATSSAFLETTAAGKPYYVLRIASSAVPEHYLRSAVVVASAAELQDHLVSGVEPDGEAILRDFCAVGPIPNASRRVWDVLDSSVCGRNDAHTRTVPQRLDEPAAS